MSQSNIGNTDLISAVNSRLVLNAVRLLQPTFRAQVSRKTGLKPATVTSIVSTLIEQGLLREVPGQVEPTARFGRPPLILEINSDARRILAMDLEPDNIRVAITDLLARPLSFAHQRIDRFNAPETILRQMIAMVKELMHHLPRKSIIGAGVSLPGLIDATNGTLISSTNMPKWKNVPVGPILEDALEVPVQVGRSLHLAAMHEKWEEPNIQDKNVVVISLRTGVGSCLIQHGQVYTGSGGMAGEIGHIIVDINGKSCECGSRGCLETFVSAGAIVARARSMLAGGEPTALSAAVRDDRELSPELIYELAAKGDPACGAIVQEVGKYLGIAIANIINLLAPDDIIICGAIDVAEEPLLKAIRQQVQVSALPRLRESVTIRTARERERLPLLGAAVLIAQSLFELPQLKHAAFTTIDGLAHEHRESSGKSRGKPPAASKATKL
jgi:predicted NBD/HSP70 family sugar kinase